MPDPDPQISPRWLAPWTPEELALLAQLYPDLSNAEVAQRLGRSVKSVLAKAARLQLKKSAARKRAMGAENVKLRRDRS